MRVVQETASYVISCWSHIFEVYLSMFLVTTKFIMSSVHNTDKMTARRGLISEIFSPESVLSSINSTS